MEHTMELIRLAQQGDKEAAGRLIEENTGLIWSVVRKFVGRGYDLDDLFQIGSMGLLKCIQKFDESFQVRFSTYAVPMIMGEIKRFLRDDGLIKVSRPLKELAIKAKYVQDDLAKKTGESPTINQIAESLGVNREELVMALEAGKDVESLYQTIYQSDGSPIYLIDKLDLKQNEAGEMTDIIALKEILSKLKPKERQIIMLRYFEEKTQTEIAKEIGVSQVQISRIEKKIIQNIRDSFG
ncbi:RNA polymerase sporulation sigma factor SigF [Tyzzerella sp. OttesenSCG-928-J15]|nr:RNA polymerase sporulation sigma factor SigF [Tyzzerella sp. OttesenSCG-928-J15]